MKVKLMNNDHDLAAYSEPVGENRSEILARIYALLLSICEPPANEQHPPNSEEDGQMDLLTGGYDATEWCENPTNHANTSHAIHPKGSGYGTE